MKTIFFTLFAVSSTYAQQPSATGFFQYQMRWKNAQIICDLFYKNNESAFVLYSDRLTMPSDTVSESTEGNNRTNIRVNINDGKDFVLYKNYADRRMISREVVANGKKVIVQDTLPELVWKLEGERKQIGPYSCQKATTMFRCARYTVWFTTAIPLEIGPWKLHGLPGLIVEATNENIDLSYTLLKASYPATGALTYKIGPPRSNDPVYTFAQFGAIQNREIKKMETYMRSMAGNPSGGQFRTQMPECFPN